jgi:HlyD family secretion protein
MANQKKSKKKLFIFSGLGLLVIVLIIVAIIGGKKDDIVTVQTEKVQKRDITQTVTATGKVNSEFQVIITPEVTGEITDLPVKEGDQVKKGNLLIRIKGDIYKAQKERAVASLQSARSNLAMRKAALDKVLLDYNRIIELNKKKLSSDSELEQAKSNYLTSKASYESAQGDVMQMEAGLREINEQLSKTTINSPMDGTVGGLSVEKGERVLGSGYSQGTTLMTIADLNNMEATVEVDENDVVLISLGDTAYIKVDAFGERKFLGVVTEIGNAAKTTAQGTQEQVVNFDVKIKIIDAEKKLKPGMSCTAEIRTETKTNVLSVPIQSVTSREGMQQKPVQEEGSKAVSDKKAEKKVTEIVFVVENGKAKQKVVKTGLSNDNYIEIIEGLKENEEVVSGSYKAISRDLNDGIAVKTEDKKKMQQPKS